jgi:uncharacterized protein YlxP (DUF503 family)
VPGSTFVVLLRVHLFFPDAGSLKAKRAELNRTKAWLRDRLGAAVAEVDGQDTWQRSVLAVSLVGSTLGRCEEGADTVQRFLDSRFPQGVRIERAIASWSDLEAIG